MEAPVQIGRYVLHDEIASGGMAKVHLGRATGALGFSRIVAIKRVLPHLLGEQDFLEMFIDETRLAARIQHPNVISTLDAVVTGSEVFLVMEHVLGEAAGRLFRAARKRNEPVPVDIALSIVCGALRGLHAAHEARSDRGELLGVVHRDVSPQNVLVGVDGGTRVIDFGVAKARGRLQVTQTGKIKGKLAYMSPEQLRGADPDRRTDIYAAGIILWEALAGRRLHHGDNDALVYANVLHNPVYPPSQFASHVSPEVDAIVMRAIDRDPERRFDSAEEMAAALEQIVPLASPTKVGAWVRHLASDVLDARAARVSEIERGVYLPAVPMIVQGDSGSFPNASGPNSRPGSALTGPEAARPSVSERSGTGFDRSMAYDTTPDQRRSRAIVLGILGASVTTFALVLLLFVWIPRATHGRVSRAPSASAFDESPAPALPVAATLPTPATADAPAAALASPSASENIVPAPAPSHATSIPKPAADRRMARATCDPPWVIDPKGIKRFKPECM